MMKYLILCCFVFGTHLCVAQQTHDENPSKRISFQLAVNSGFLLKKIVNVGDFDSLYGNPFLINGTVYFKEKYFARFSVGGERKRTFQQEEGFLDKIETLKYRSAIRFGLGIKKLISHRWECAGAIDGTYQSRVNNFLDDSGFDQIESINQDNAYGGGLSGSLIYKINKHLSLSVESSVYWLKGTNDRATIFRNVPELSDINIQTQTEEIQTILPSTIFVNYNF
jgi:hypothetical protein